VFNPIWHVPASIAVLELADSIRSDPDYLARHHMHVYAGSGAGAREVDPRDVPWGSAANGRFDYSIRQEPGPANALGSVTFMFPNRYTISFHDTPAGLLFGGRDRDFSHGCIRVD